MPDQDGLCTFLQILLPWGGAGGGTQSWRGDGPWPAGDLLGATTAGGAPHCVSAWEGGGGRTLAAWAPGSLGRCLADPFSIPFGLIFSLGGVSLSGAGGRAWRGRAGVQGEVRERGRGGTQEERKHSLEAV